MALSKRTINKHNIKRAEVFKQHGLNTLDIQYAHPRFETYARSEQDCVLCGHRHIKWLFSIAFDRPQALVALAKVASGIDREDEVKLQYVGSKCITDWLDAVPETPEKLEVLKRWHAEMRKCKQAMKAKVVEDLCVRAGYESPLDAYETYTGLSLDARLRLPRKERSRLANNALNIKHKRSSRGTVKNWLSALEQALKFESERMAPRFQDPSASPPSPPAGPSLSIADRDVLDRGDKVFSQNKDRLNQYRQRAFMDISRKVREAGRFVSTAQRSYFTDMLRKLES